MAAGREAGSWNLDPGTWILDPGAEQRGAPIQSRHLRGRINWLQMAHMVVIKEELAAATAAGPARERLRVVCLLRYAAPDYTSLVGSQRHVFVYIDVRVRFMYAFSFFFFSGVGGVDYFFLSFLNAPASLLSAKLLGTEGVTSDKHGGKEF